MSDGFEPKVEATGVHWMVDIESLGGTETGNGVILSIGACRFGEQGIEDKFYRSIDLWDSVMEGMTIAPDVVELVAQAEPTCPRGRAEGGGRHAEDRPPGEPALFVLKEITPTA